ncbi:hypothetical protein OH809_12435 [Streptomyces sp. NBC_00873]|nr:hypothetical protein OH809_12435 [Streptomyces sp. NBC_00873]WTA46569.1 hypothetical protein OH821_31370 [Streptomyces sp. NBC_00842]
MRQVHAAAETGVSRTTDRTRVRTVARTLKQQPANGVVGVVHAGADLELHAVADELVDDVAGVLDGSGQPVEFGHHEDVAGPHAASASRHPATCGKMEPCQLSRTRLS